MDTDWIFMARRGGAVKRFHSVRTIGEENNAEHSFGVVNIIWWITKGMASTSLIMAAVFHDLAEQEIGDLPATTKMKYFQEGDPLEHAEKEFNEKYNLVISITPEEKLILKWADRVDALIYCYEQISLGNMNMIPAFRKTIDILIATPRPEPLEIRMLDLEMEIFDRAGYVTDKVFYQEDK